MAPKMPVKFKSAFLSIFAAIFGVSAVFCLVFSISYTSRSVAYDRESKTTLSSHYLDMVVSDADHLFKQTYLSVLSLAHEGAVINLGFQNKLRSDVNSRIFSLLSSTVTQNHILEAAFIYLPELSAVLHSSFRAYDLQDFPWKSAVEEYYNGRELLPLIINDEPTSCSLFYHGRNLYFTYEYLYSGNTGKVVLFFRINTWNLYSDTVNRKDISSEIWVFRDDLSPVFSSFTKYPSYISAETLEHLSSDVHVFEDGRFLMLKTSPLNQWRYVFVQADPQAGIPFHDGLALLIGTLSVTLALAAVSSWVISKRLYAPLKDLYAQVRSNADQRDPFAVKNEIEYLNKAFSLISERSKGLDAMLQNVAPDLTSKLLAEMLSGKAVDYDYVTQNISRLSGKFEIMDLYSVGIIYVVGSLHDAEDVREDLFLRQINGMIHSICEQEELHYHPLQYDASTMIYIFSKSAKYTKLSFVRQLKEIRHTLTDAALSEGIQIVMATGEVYDSILHIRFSYKDAAAMIEEKKQMLEGNEDGLQESGSILSEDPPEDRDEFAPEQEGMADSRADKGDVSSGPASFGKKEIKQGILHILSCIDSNDFHHAYALGKELINKLNDFYSSGEAYKYLLHEAYEQISEIEYINTDLFEDGLFTLEETSDGLSCEIAEKKLQQILDILISQKKRSQNHYITAAQKYLQRNYSDGSVSLSQVAEAIGTNPSYLSKLFKQNLGITFTDYLNKYRVKQSLDLLISTSDPVQDIAERCGFNSPQSYNRVFKKYYQITPTQYRETNK